MADRTPTAIRGPRIDITGQNFGRWTVLSFAGAPHWRCRCECGTERLVTGQHLKSGHSTSCGCYKREVSSKRNSAKLEGRKFGRLTVLSRDGSNRRYNSTWLCRCDCGESVTVPATRLLSGLTQSCGCLHREAIRTHGGSRTRTYGIWQHMRQRCLNPRADTWERYGGRGIGVCARWARFENFLEDMGEAPAHHSLDRIDNDGNYEPGNCRWATAKQQLRNTSRNKMVQMDGRTMLLTDAISELRQRAKSQEAD